MLIVDLGVHQGLESFEFADGALWMLDNCCSRSINGSSVIRIDLDGNVTDRFRFAFQAGAMEFDGTDLWLSHTEDRAFTKLSTKAEGPLWISPIGPYTEQEIVIETDGATIAGTLTVPNTPGPHPAVILVPDSWAAGRDEPVFGFSHGLKLADNFARHGMAVFRYDQRGSGASTGRIFDYTWRELADDLHVIVDTVQSQPSVDADQVGLWALASSVWHGTPVIAERDDIAFAVFMNQSGTSALTESFAPQLLAVRYTAEPVEQFESLVDQYNIAVEIMRSGGDWVEFENMVRELKNDAQLANGVFSDVTALPFFSLREIESKFWSSVIDFDLGPVLSSIEETPYIATYGGLNLLIHPEFFEPPTLEAIKRSGNPDARTVVFPHMNDLLQPAISGKQEEYDLRPQVIYPSYIRPGFIEYTSNWILERVEFAGD